MSNHQHILIIRLSAMGDVAMTVPVIRALTEKYPDCKITVLSKPFFKPLFDTIPQVSFFAAQVNTKHKGILGLLKLYRELKKEKITHVADFHNVLRSKILRALFIFDGKPSIFIDKGRAVEVQAGAVPDGASSHLNTNQVTTIRVSRIHFQNSCVAQQHGPAGPVLMAMGCSNGALFASRSELVATAT